MIFAAVLVEVLGIWPGLDDPQFEFLFGEFSIFFIIVLTIERWFVVVRPIQYRCKFRKKRVYIYIFTIAIATLSINIYFLLPGYDPKSTLSKLFVVIDVVLTLMVPLFVTWASYIHLWQHFKKAPTIQQSNSTKMKLKACAHVRYHGNVYNSMLDSGGNLLPPNRFRFYTTCTTNCLDL